MKGPMDIEPVPEDEQGPIRARLRNLRIHHGLSKSQVAGITDQTLGTYERVDCSTLSLRRLWHIARNYGWTLSQMLGYLAGNLDEVMPQLEENRDLRTMIVYMRALPPELSAAALALVAELVSYNAAHNGGADLHALRLNSSLRAPNKVRSHHRKVDRPVLSPGNDW